VRLFAFLFSCLVASSLCPAQDSNSVDGSDVSGKSVTSGEVIRAREIKTVPIREVVDLANKSADEQCKKTKLVEATTDGNQFTLDNVNYSIDDFADELIRRYKEKAFYCVRIVGPGYAPLRLGHLTHRLHDKTEIARINWAKGD